MPFLGDICTLPGKLTGIYLAPESFGMVFAGLSFCFLLGVTGLFSGALAVSFREGSVGWLVGCCLLVVVCCLCVCVGGWALGYFFPGNIFMDIYGSLNFFPELGDKISPRS